MFKNNNKTDIIEQKMIFFESLSKDMSLEFKKIIEKLSDSNIQIVNLISKQDLRLNTLDINANSINQDLKGISSQLEIQNNRQETVTNSIHSNIKELDNKIIEIIKFKTIVIWSLTAAVTVLGILASGGWISPSRFENKPNNSQIENQK